MKKQGEEDLSIELKQSAVYAHTLAVGLSNVEVTAARMELYAEDMLDKIGNDTSNSAILMAEYLSPCKLVLEDPESRFQYWLDK